MAKRRLKEERMKPPIQWSWKLTLGDVVGPSIVIVGAVIVWFSLPAQVTKAQADINKLEVRAGLIERQNQDEAERLKGVETTLQFMVPALQRIEDRLNRIKL